MAGLVDQAARFPGRAQPRGAGAAGQARCRPPATAWTSSARPRCATGCGRSSIVQAHQDINVEGIRDADVIAAHQAGGHTCVQVFFFRGGSNFGNRGYFPSHDRNLPLPQVLAAFLAQFYANKPPPPLILVNELPAEADLLTEALGIKAERKVEILQPVRGARRKLIDNALANAREALARRMAENASQRHLLEGVQQALGLEQVRPAHRGL